MLACAKVTFNSFIHPYISSQLVSFRKNWQSNNASYCRFSLPKQKKRNPFDTLLLAKHHILPWVQLTKIWRQRERLWNLIASVCSKLQSWCVIQPRINRSPIVSLNRNTNQKGWNKHKGSDQRNQRHKTKESWNVIKHIWRQSKVQKDTFFALQNYSTRVMAERFVTQTSLPCVVIAFRVCYFEKGPTFPSMFAQGPEGSWSTLEDNPTRLCQKWLQYNLYLWVPMSLITAFPSHQSPV